MNNKYNVFNGFGGFIAYACACLALIVMNRGLNKRFDAQSVQFDALQDKVEQFCNGYVPHDTIVEYQVKRDTIVEYKFISR